MAASLKPYPFPEGMEIPRLMPFQEYPWNNDPHLAAEVLRLKEAHGLRHAFETGTCLGSTTIWLSKNFAFVTSTEIHQPYRDIAVARLKIAGREDCWAVVGGDADELLMQLRDYTGFDTLCFLDAHPMTGKGEYGYATVIRELKAISNANVKPVIVVHDMQVPDLPEAGWDTYNGQPFTLEWFWPYLDRIYGEGKWKYNYPTQVAGAMRGWISIEPC